MNRFTIVLACVCLALSLKAAQPQRPFVSAQPAQSKLLADFTLEDTRKAVVAEHPGIKLSGLPAGIQIAFPPREKFPLLTLWQSAQPSDWTGYDALTLTVTNPGATRIALWFYLADQNTTKDSLRAEFLLPCEPGKNNVVIPLAPLFRANHSSALDMSKMTKVRAAVERHNEPTVQIDALKLVKLFDKTVESFYLFDFGPAAKPLFHGATPVSPNTVYDKDRRYGLMPGEYQGSDAYAAIPLVGDCVNSGKSVAFAVDVKNGKYQVQAVAFNLEWQNARRLGHSIEAEGQTVVDVPRTPAAFYSPNGMYWGVDIFHDPAKTMWQQYGAELFKPHVFTVEVKDGQLNLDFKKAAVFSLAIFPAEQAEAGQRRLEALIGELDWRVASSHKIVPAPNPGEELEQLRAGPYSVFARHYTLLVQANRNPKAEELVNKLALAAAPGEYEPTTFAIHPRTNLSKVAIDVSDLAGPNGAAIPKSALKLDIVKYFPARRGNIVTLTPSYLYPYKPIDIQAGMNRQYWLTVQVPENAAAGLYQGKITIAPEGAVKKELDLEVKVWPFKLADSSKGRGTWTNTALRQHEVNTFPEKFDELARETTENEIADLVAHGMTGYFFSEPKAISFNADGSELKLDFRVMDIQAAVVKKFGLEKNTNLGHYGGATFYAFRKGIPTGQNILSRSNDAKEHPVPFTPAYDRAYHDLCTQIVDWTKRSGVNLAVQLFDEPREQEDDYKSFGYRSRVACIGFLRRAAQVPGFQKMITLMGDRDHFRDDYTPLIPLADIVATHSWEGSKQIELLAGKERLAQYYLYNNGMDRFPFGFYLWKSPGLAHWQWVYSWSGCDAAAPLINDQIGIGDAIVPYLKKSLPRLGWEWVREGVDDLKYMATLEKTIAEGKQDSVAVKGAQAFVVALRKFLPEFPEHGLETGAEAGGKYTEGGLKAHFDAWRLQAAEYIAAIKSGGEPQKVEAAWAAFPAKISEESKSATCLLVNESPKVDGKLDEALWKDAEVLGNFLNLARAESASIPTEARVVCDGKRIYFGFHCKEPKYGELKGYATQRDGDVWRDDSIEIFMDTKNDQEGYFQVCVNWMGTILDNEKRDAIWDGDIQVGVDKGKGYWSVEVAIGLEKMKATAGEGTTWGLNLCRNRAPVPSETTSWTHVGSSFHNPKKFGKLVFKKKD